MSTINYDEWHAMRALVLARFAWVPISPGAGVTRKLPNEKQAPAARAVYTFRVACVTMDRISAYTGLAPYSIERLIKGEAQPTPIDMLRLTAAAALIDKHDHLTVFAGMLGWLVCGPGTPRLQTVPMIWELCKWFALATGGANLPEYFRAVQTAVLEAMGVMGAVESSFDGVREWAIGQYNVVKALPDTYPAGVMAAVKVKRAGGIGLVAAGGTIGGKGDGPSDELQVIETTALGVVEGEALLLAVAADSRSKKGRGRPKGARNKPKTTVEGEGETKSHVQSPTTRWEARRAESMAKAAAIAGRPGFSGVGDGV